MSTFKTSGIVIKKSQINEKQEMLVVFSKEFGKIVVFSKITKKEKMLDIGNIFNFEAKVKNDSSVTDMKNITILYQFQYTSWTYDMMIEFMEILKILYDFCPKWIPNQEIFELFENLRHTPLTHEKFIFAKIKLYEILWLLEMPQKNPTIQKIFLFVSQNSIQKILKLTGLNQELLSELKNIFEKIKK